MDKFRITKINRSIFWIIPQAGLLQFNKIAGEMSKSLFVQFENRKIVQNAFTVRRELSITAPFKDQSYPFLLNFS